MKVLIERPREETIEKNKGLTTEAAQINRRHDLVRKSARKALLHAIKAGILLRRVKRREGYGNFTVWIAAHCTFSPRTAQFYMKVAGHRKELKKAKSISDLTGAIKLLRKSNRPNKNGDNKDTLPKDTGKLVAALSKSCLETKHLIERIDEKEGKEFWAKADPTVARVAKRAEDLMSALRVWFGERK